MTQLTLSQIERVDKFILNSDSIKNETIQKIYLNYSQKIVDNFKEVLGNESSMFKSEISLWVIYLTGGFLFSIFSLIFCILGKRKLNKLEASAKKCELILKKK